MNNALLTTPYGMVAEEHAFTLALTQWINPNMAWNLRYGFFKGSDDAYGGFSDYAAHMVSAGFRYRF